MFRSLIPVLDRLLTAAAVALLLLSVPAHAGVDEDTVTLAATGRFDQLETLLESEAAKRQFRTRDQHALCFAYSKTKRYDRLFTCLDQVERLVAKGDRRTRLFGLDDATPSIRLMRAEALLELGQYADAVKAARAVMTWITDEGSDDRDLEIQAMSTMVIAAVTSGDRPEAEKWLQKIEDASVAFPLFDDYAPVKVFALARGYAALGRFDKAVEMLESDRYFKLRKFLDNLFSGAIFQGTSYWMWAELPRGYLLAKSRLETGRHAQAKEDLDRLLAIPAASANGEIYWLMLFDRGRIAEHEGKLDEAIGFYRRAIEIIEQQRSTINTEINKIGFVTDKQTVYSRLVAVALKAGRQTDAFEAAERSKSRALVDLLAAKRDFGGESATLVAELENVEKEVLVQRGLDAEGGRTVRGRLAAQTDRLRRAQPELSSLITVSSIAMDGIRKHLLKNEVLVEFFGDDQNLVAFVFGSNDVQAFTLDGAGLESEIRALRKAMKEQEESVTASAKRLYQRLLAPLGKAVSGKDLMIVPHGILHYLPFSMLHDGKDFIVASSRLRILPSSSVVQYLERPKQRAPDRMVIFGNPDLGDARLDLPSAEVEAKTIAARITGSSLLVRGQATESAFKKLAPDFRYIHIASHGQFNAENALSSRLLLAKGENEDGSLTVNELYQLRLGADLVVLSACETGLGRVTSGDDLVGLTRGFLYAGSGNIVASLWEVDDEATSELMQEFYRGVAAGMDKRQALRDAQNKLRINNPHPFFWSAFYLTGNGH